MRYGKFTTKDMDEEIIEADPKRIAQLQSEANESDDDSLYISEK